MDEYTGEILDLKLIREAVMKELRYFNDHQTWQIEELNKVTDIADAVHVRTRWVLCNKGDPDNLDMRAGLVARGGEQDWQRCLPFMRLLHRPNRRRDYSHSVPAAAPRPCLMVKYCLCALVLSISKNLLQRRSATADLHVITARAWASQTFCGETDPLFLRHLRCGNDLGTMLQRCP